MKSKKIYTAVAVMLLIGLYITIFWFSAEDGEKSSALSRKVTETILRIYYRMTAGIGSGSGGVMAVRNDVLEGIIRKLAHCAEYLCMGFLSYSIVILWYKPVWKGRLIVLLQLLLSAVADEFHQYFIPGRFASFKDVMIDTAGGIVGILLMTALHKMKMKNNKYRVFPVTSILK